MSTSLHEAKRDATAASDATRKRRCLMCRDTFDSAWSGERVCRTCKGKTNWREGAVW